MRRAVDARWTGVLVDSVGMVDATQLWVSVRAGLGPGERFALRDGRGLIELRTTGHPALFDLAEHVERLRGADAELVVVGRGRTRRVRPASMIRRDERPALAPPVPGTGMSFRLHYRPVVTVSVEERSAALDVQQILLVDNQVEVRVDLPRQATVQARLGLEDRSQSVDLTSELTDEGWVLRLAESDVPVDGLWLMWATSDGHELPVCRAATDLRDQGRVPLPWLPGVGDGGATGVRVEFTRSGQLSARRHDAVKEMQ